MLLINRFRIEAVSWEAFQAHGPTILIYQDSTNFTDNNQIYYSPEKIPEDFDDTFVARGAGPVVFLPTAGKWWIYSLKAANFCAYHVDGWPGSSGFFQDRGYTQIRAAGFTLGNAFATTMLSANQTRRYTYVENIGAATCTLLWMNTIAGTNGFRLPSGATNPLSRYEWKDEAICQGRLTGICTGGASSSVVVIEGYN